MSSGLEQAWSSPRGGRHSARTCCATRHIARGRSDFAQGQVRRRDRGATTPRQRFDVVYIGLSDSSVRRRLRRHIQSKGSEWTHFSVYEVWDNIRRDEIDELEGLFRHIYRFDFYANKLNVARSYRKLGTLRRQTAQEGWMEGTSSGLRRNRHLAHLDRIPLRWAPIRRSVRGGDCLARERYPARSTIRGSLAEYATC